MMLYRMLERPLCNPLWGNRMASIDDLLAALDRAARANQRDEFDRYESDLLSRFGGFNAMPREIYERYLEIDRAWPASLSTSLGTASSHITTLPIHARVPDDLISWLHELGAETGHNRSDVLTACLQAVRDDAGTREMVIKALRGPTPTRGDPSDR